MTKERYSKQREAIYNAVQNTKSHPTAEWVYDKVRQDLPTISLGTIYRNLNYLVDKGAIREVILDDNVTRYDGNYEQHFHCICEKCGTIYDVELDTNSVIAQISRQISDFSVQSHKLEIYGICQKCKNDT